MNDFQFEKDLTPLWKHLGLTDSYTVEDVLSAYELLTDEQKQDEKIVFAWKSLSDPMYAEMYRLYQSTTALYQAGFFIDPYQSKINYEVDFLTTPYDKIVEAISKAQDNGKPYIVVLTTGSFSPFHKGHMHLMDVAKKTMKDAGYHVVGGYISPSHDEYVSQKANGQAALHVEKRSYLIETAIHNSDWLYLDKWEGYYNRHAINFSDVIHRLEAYLNKHIPTTVGIKVCYVYGGDNAAFGRAFLSDHYAVCVNRSGSDDKFSALRQELMHLPNVLFVEENTTGEISSTSVRNGCSNSLHDEVNELYLKFIEERDLPVEGVYAIRNDLNYASPLPLEESSPFLEEVKNLFQEFFGGGLSVDVISSVYQHSEVTRQLQNSNLPTISLDAFIRGDMNLEISRLFELGSMQFRSKGLTNRPFTPALEEQAKSIPPGEYLLIEDDVASGFTLQKVKDLLSPTVLIKDMLILSSLDGGTNSKGYYDIIDLRDFLFGSKSSGLVTTLPNASVVRVPYVLPYVSPISRASVPVGKELDFSIRMWEMNRRFYAKYPRTLAQMDQSLIELMRYIGFSDDSTMLEIIDWHLALLKGE